MKFNYVTRTKYKNVKNNEGLKPYNFISITLINTQGLEMKPCATLGVKCGKVQGSFKMKENKSTKTTTL